MNNTYNTNRKGYKNVFQAEIETNLAGISNKGTVSSLPQKMPIKEK